MRVMETMNIILSGLGGQGILFMTKVLAQAAMDKGFAIMGAETHGMAQRGGSVVSHLRLGDVQSSLVRTGTAHFLLSLEENEGYRNFSFLSQGGRIYVNTTSKNFPRKEVRKFLEKKEIIYRSIPAGIIAQGLGAPRSSNLALLGYFSAFQEGPVGYHDMKGTIDRISPPRFKDINTRIFDAGHERGEIQKGSFH